jgi:hypothetical protein
MGLYDDDKQSATTGDILDVVYWQTKYAALQLQAAVAGRQPEGAVRQLVPGVINGCNDLLKEYPNHDGLKQWQQYARDIETKIDPNAPSADFKSSFAYWKDFSYESAWRFCHLALMSEQDDDLTMARSYASDAEKNLNRAVDRMTDWPDDIKVWVNKSLSDMQRILGR